MKNIVYIADIADDIDDVIAIEYLLLSGMLNCVVLDSKSRDTEREQRLIDIGVTFKTEIPKNTKILFCGGALTKVNEFIKVNEIDLLVMNGGFVGNNIVKTPLKKFKNKEKVRTYNFNMDVDSALGVLFSENVREILLVSKNVCHSEVNCINKLHIDSFLDHYKLNEGKRLHDLLMVKEGVNFLLKGDMLCSYINITPTIERKNPDNMSIWGSEINQDSNIKISNEIG